MEGHYFRQHLLATGINDPELPVYVSEDCEYTAGYLLVLLLTFCVKGLSCFPSIKPNDTVSKIYGNHEWQWPRSTDPLAREIERLVSAITPGTRDVMIWSPNESGKFTSSSVRKCLRDKKAAESLEVCGSVSLAEYILINMCKDGL
ncbi:hypothetical protein CRG98_013641 [Punica granatum]|uniref:Uncharacterized protein n=1 Tax=Punica granatum TaxID=22663 RepID=A0A2I0KBS2_PUNGR|nr:hypothetical protein CRG98_013641 [Punica granatum]